MITVNGLTYGTATEVARHLGRGVTVAMVRRWADREGLTHAKAGRTVLYRLDEAEQIEADKRYSGCGRPRQLDKGSCQVT